jgi:adenylate kinase
MRIILLGAPGSGKGTQGPVLAEHFGAVHVSAGELLRLQMAASTELGGQIGRYVRAGELVPDEIVFEILWERITKAAAGGGYVLDGFPRNLRQAELAFERARPAGVTADAVVYLAVPDDLVRSRLVARARREGRSDDLDPDVTERRLLIFHSETEPLLDFYRNRDLLVTVDASAPPEAVSAAMIAALDRHPRSETS